MITYPYESKFQEDSIQTDIVITDGTASYSGTTLVVTGYSILMRNSDISSEQMSLLESLCTEETLHFGCCESSEIKFTIHSNVVPLEGKTLNVYLFFENDANTLFKIGTYKVYSDIATAQKTMREVTCYDLMFDVLNADYTDWYNSLDFTTVDTVKKFRDAFFAHIGITQETITLINDAAPIAEVTLEALSGATILRAICEINGRFGHMNRQNQFVYVKLEQNIQGLYPAIDLYPSPTLYPRRPKSVPIASGSYIPPLKYEKYEVPSITRLQIRTDDSDIGVVVGSAGTDYVIQGNFLCFNLNATQLTNIANNILGEIGGVVFQPFETQMRADLCLEVGDAVRCNDNYTGVEGYILYRNVVGIQAMIDTFNCNSSREYKLNANSVGYQFNAVNNRTARLKTDIDEVSVELTYQLDPTAGEPGGTNNSYAYQTAQEIGAKVETTTYNNFVNNTFATFVTQTDSALTAKAEKTVGNFTTGFSCTLDTTGHTWYKDDQQVMKIDSNGLTVTGNITGSDIYGGTITGYTSISSANISGGSITGAQIAGGSITIADTNNYDMVVIYDGKLSILDNVHNYRLENQHNLIRFFQGDNTRGIIDGASYVDTFAITGKSKLLLDGDSEVVVSGIYTTVGGSSNVHIDGDDVTQISGGSFRRIRFHSYYGSETTINLKDDIIDKISSLESRVTALENA